MTHIQPFVCITNSSALAHNHFLFRSHHKNFTPKVLNTWKTNLSPPQLIFLTFDGCAKNRPQVCWGACRTTWKQTGKSYIRIFTFFFSQNNSTYSSSCKWTGRLFPLSPCPLLKWTSTRLRNKSESSYLSWKKLAETIIWQSTLVFSHIQLLKSV